ncbi:hypothetical protein NKH77_02820 [Streptomyces sp. M19]
MARAVGAWEYGGPAALAVLEERWTPGEEVLARVRGQLDAARERDGRLPRLRADGNRWTAEESGAQLRYGRDGLWWPYREEGGQWWPAGPPDRDPAAALDGIPGR